MPSKGSAKGATLEYRADSALAALSPITEVGDFDFPYGEAAILDITVHGSPNNTKEKTGGVIDPGSFSFPIQLDDTHASHAWLLTNLGATKVFKYTPKDGTGYLFWAVITSITRANPVEGSKEYQVTLTPAGGTIPAGS